MINFLQLCRPILMWVLITCALSPAWAQQDDGEDDPIGWDKPDVLQAGKKLLPGQSLVNGAYELTLQSDGNLVVYQSNAPIWNTGTWGYTPGYLMLEDNGDLVLYDSNGSMLWASNTGGTDPSNLTRARYLRITHNGTLVIHGDQGAPTAGKIRQYGVRLVSRTLTDSTNNLMCVDVTNANTSNYANVQLYQCNSADDGDAQTFIYNSADNTIRMRKAENKCLDAYWNSNGANIYLYSCNGTDAQKFLYNAAAGTFKKKSAPSMCIDVSNSGTSNGTNIQLYTCNGSNAQKFDLRNSGASGTPVWINSLSLVKRDYTSKCIDVSNGGTANGTNIQLWDCSGSSAQKFSYNKIDGTFRLQSSPNKCIDVSNGSSNNSTNVQLWDCNGGAAQRFDFELANGLIRFRAYPNKCLDVAGGWNWNGTNIQIYDCNSTGAQRFNAGSQPLHSYSIDFHHVDDDVYLYINGINRMYFNITNPGLQEIDPAWLNYGSNTFRILHGNYGCWATSLGTAIFRNMEDEPAVIRYNYHGIALCGWQADWYFDVNTATGRIRQTQ